jgi:hypothetical protein
MEIVDYKPVYFTFGRFQPCTWGHEENFRSLKTIADGNDWFIIPSPSVGDAENPLPAEVRIKYMKKALPWASDHLLLPSYVTRAGANNPVVASIQSLQDMGYDKCYMVVGSDRVNAFSWTKRRNGIDYAFYDYDIISSGKRDADGDTFRISGTKMRRAAVAGDYKSFKEGMPKPLSESDTKKLMAEIKSRMPADYK